MDDERFRRIDAEGPIGRTRRENGDASRAEAAPAHAPRRPQDVALDDAIASAFDRMGPSEEAEARMLAAVLSARGEHALPTARETGGLPLKPIVADCPTQQRKTARTSRFVLQAVAAAACLVLVAGVGAFALYANGLNGRNTSGSSQSAVQSIGDGASAGSSAEPSKDASTGNEAPQADQSVGAESASSSSNGSAGEDAGARYPLVQLASGQTLRVVLDDAGRPLTADPSLVGAELEQATAFGGASGDTTACAVFASADVAHPFAVRYDGGDRYYWADEAG
ncbi:hypothetical protein C1878_05030 [Gordonibacter sp. 28C]|uniref:hypothetical protein n=1 Tax=Gordonibacter sp. 28C TaxID=2078569 RepID=UPI000DF73559|nr:hypothetical protein [Gordonibacter sp. 28C]RDB63230.1 hypothetical protein C1878_05030 [Gordonibacter sp. 28C]